MLTVFGRGMHLLSRGHGPSVVILAGQGDFSLSWHAIQTQLADKMRVTLYDRAGLGWSDPGPKDATVSDAVEDLAQLLYRAGIPGPHILVGHSFGGMIARLYAHRYPHEVAGLVLVDASHEDQFTPELIQQTLKKMAWMMPLMMGAFKFLVQTGLAALNPALIPDLGGVFAHMDAETQRTYRTLLASHPEHLAASANELRTLEQSNTIMRQVKITSLGDLPLIVLRHGKEQPQMGGPEVTQLLEETFACLQVEMSRLSPRGKLIVAEQSGHAIHLEQPDCVIQAIHEVVNTALVLENSMG
jgi:pimeloyl-ACP methyl ester carboxylesterase